MGPVSRLHRLCNTAMWEALLSSLSLYKNGNKVTASGSLLAMAQPGLSNSNDGSFPPLTLRQRLWLFPIMAKLREWSRLSALLPKFSISYYRASVRDNHGRFSRKQGEIVVQCFQHRCDALPSWSKLGHTHDSLLSRPHYISSVSELGTRSKAGSLDGLPLRRGKVALDRTTTGWHPRSSFPLLPR